MTIGGSPVQGIGDGGRAYGNATFLPLAGGNLSGDLTLDAGKTVDGVDLSAHAAAQDAHVITPTTFAEALAYAKAVPPTLRLPTGISGGVGNLAAGGGAAPQYQVGQNELRTTATANAVSGERFDLYFAALGATRNRINFDGFLILELRYERQQAVANSVAYVKIGADAIHGALAGNGLGVYFNNLAATLQVYDGSLHSTAAGWSITASQTTSIMLIHLPGVGSALYTNDVQRVVDVTNILSGTAAAGNLVVVSLANGATATDHYVWHSAISLWVPRT